MKVEFKRTRFGWIGPVDGTELQFTVIGTYGPKCDPLILTDDGYKAAINWKTGEVIKSFGQVKENLPLDFVNYYGD